MSPALVAAIAATTRAVGDRFEALGIPDPHDAAERLIRSMQRDGWRLHPELADGAPPRPAKAHPDVQAAAVAQARAAVEATRRSLQATEVPS